MKKSKIGAQQKQLQPVQEVAEITPLARMTLSHNLLDQIHMFEKMLKRDYGKENLPTTRPD